MEKTTFMPGGRTIRKNEYKHKQKKNIITK